MRIRSKRGGEDWREDLRELSGGQRTLMHLSMLLAVARYRPGMVLLLDEIDAALDEANAARIGSLLASIAAHTQVVAISHRPEFLALAHKLIHLHKSHDQTVAGARPAP
uniref:RecF/RecN/SMC N-terminal domain-containing protein n=1 Tax=Calcidiscus leptoporus TaxID=127549 RepID=A0A6U5LFS3_9EUKA